MLRLGVDVGGTNPDAAVVSGTEVLGTAKVTTTPDVTDGVVAAARAALDASHVRVVHRTLKMRAAHAARNLVDVHAARLRGIALS